MRSSNWPGIFVPATIIARSGTTIRRSRSNSGRPLDHALANPSQSRSCPRRPRPSSTGFFLRAAAEDCSFARSFLAADHRIELALPGQFVRSRRSYPARGSSTWPAAARFAAPAGSPRQDRGPLRALGPFHAVAQEVQTPPRGPLPVSARGSSTPGRQRLPARGAIPRGCVRCRRSCG